MSPHPSQDEQRPKHTAGPWSVRPEDESVSPYIVAGPDGCSVADCGVGFRYDAERLPNARLIAAAPEMFEALTDIADRLSKQIPATRHYLVQNGIDPHFADVLLSHYGDFERDARAAIAKATGEAQ